MEASQRGELAQLQADVQEQVELTKRLEADMASDSWLSKNIRPMTLIAILAGYFLFAGLSAQVSGQQNLCGTVGSVGYVDYVFLLRGS